VRAGMSTDRPEILENVPLEKFTTWGVGGTARYYWRYAERLLPHAIDWASKMAVPWVILGKGSNVLIEDSGFDGLVIHMVGNRKISIDHAVGTVACSATVPMPALAMATAKLGFTGLEWMAAIPGTVGGGIVMNAGVGSVFNGDISSHLISGMLFQPGVGFVEIPSEKCNFGYRYSRLQAENSICISGIFRITKEENSLMPLSRLTSLLKARKAKQPLAQRTAGSTFKSPAGHPIGKLLEKSGVRGLKIGGARVSDTHCNWIETSNGCKSSDIVKIICEMRRLTFVRYGIRIDPEVKRIPRSQWPWEAECH